VLLVSSRPLLASETRYAGDIWSEQAQLLES